MTNKQINAAIAEACGWTCVSAVHASGIAPNTETHPRLRSSLRKNYVGNEFIPNYCNSLEAMHQAEKCLSEKHMREYIFELHNITDGDMNAQGDFWDRAKLYYPVVCATARERAEAFLRALKLWEEEE